MKKNILISLIVLSLGCTSKTEKNNSRQTPDALEDHKSSSLVDFKKRVPDDLVDELYEEAIKKSPGLADLEKGISEFNEMKNDSLKVFENYQSKNQDYYTSATRHLSSIQDSNLRKEVTAALEKNKTAYTNIISRLNELEKKLDGQSLYTEDHRVVLKMFVTLGMMEQYKKGQTPPTTLLQSVLDANKTLNYKLDSAIAKTNKFY